MCWQILDVWRPNIDLTGSKDITLDKLDYFNIKKEINLGKFLLNSWSSIDEMSYLYIKV